MKKRMKKIILTVVLCGVCQQGYGMKQHDDEANPRKKRRIECEQTDAETLVYDERLNRDLESAVYFGKKDRIKSLLENRANPNARSLGGSTPLMYAAGHGDEEIVEILLAANAEVNLQNKLGETPLIFAALRGHAETIQKLLDAGADITMQDCNGYTAFDLAKANGRADAVRLLENAWREFQIRLEQKKQELAVLKEAWPQCPLELIDSVVTDYL